jgi:dolichol-phosphate mannosyltransferase
MNLSLTIIIPCHNEEEAITYTLSEVYKKLQYDNFKVLIVNDHSSDKTVQIINKFVSDKKISNLYIVDNKRSGCFANALLTGLENFDTDLVVPMMGDLCDQVETIPEMIETIQSGFDIAVASRYMKGGKKINSPHLQGFFSWAVCFSLKILGNLPTWDVSNAYKMYKKEVINKILPILEGNAGTDFSMQLFLKTLKAGYIAKEVPTTWTGRIYGKAKFDPFKLTPKYWRWYKYALISAWFPKFVDKT